MDTNLVFSFCFLSRVWVPTFVSLGHILWSSLSGESVSRAISDLFSRSHHQRPPSMELIQMLLGEGSHPGARPLFFGSTVLLQYRHVFTREKGYNFTKCACNYELGDLKHLHGSSCRHFSHGELVVQVYPDPNPTP